MKCENEAEIDSEAAVNIVQFLVENFEEVLKVPADLKQEVVQRIAKANSTVEPKVNLYTF